MRKILLIIMMILFASFASAGDIALPYTYLGFDNRDATSYQDQSSVQNLTFTNYSSVTRVTTNCIIGDCADFPGVDAENIRVEPPAKWIMNTTMQGSLSVWINVTGDVSPIYGIVIQGETSDIKFFIGLDDNSDGLTVVLSPTVDTGTDSVRDDTSLSDGQWHHIVLTASGSGGSWLGYIDGALITWDNIDNSAGLVGGWFGDMVAPSGEDRKTQFGGAVQGGWDNYGFDGRMDEIALYDFVLTGPATNCAADNTSQVCDLWRDGRGYNPLNGSTTYTANANILPTTPNNGTQLTGYCNATSTINENVTMEYEWYKNAVLYSNGELYGQTDVNYNTSIVPASALSCGDTLSYKCRAYNSSYSSWSIVNKSIACTTNTTVRVRVQNLLTGNYMVANYTIRNSTGALMHENNNSAAGYYSVAVGGDGDNFTIVAEVGGSANVNTTLNIPTGQTRSVTLFVSLAVSANIYDEAQSGIDRTNVAFNINEPKSMDFILYCDSNETIITQVTTQPHNFSLNCTYRKFGFLVTYNNSQSYYRRFIEDSQLLNETGSFNAYLPDYNDTIIQIQFNLIDLAKEYKNTKIVIKKVINDQNVVIHADYAETSIIAYLLYNEEYSIEIQSSNRPTIFYGYYTPTAYEVKYLSISPISFDYTPSGVSAVQHTTWASNSTGTLNAYLYFNDTESLTTSYNWSLHANTTNGELLYSIIASSTNTILSTDISEFENRTIVTKVTHTRDPSISDYTKIIHIDEDELELGLKTQIGQTWMNWLITILLGVILLYGSSTSPGITILVIGLLAAILRVFNWYSLHVVYIALILLLGILVLLKKGESDGV